MYARREYPYLCEELIKELRKPIEYGRLGQRDGSNDQCDGE